jgi:long-subunit fatty acid transport protein
LGGDYDVTKKLQLRGGGLFYWAVVPDDHYIPAIPDANKLGVTLGSRYNLTKNMSLDLSYVNIFSLRRSVNNNISQSLGGDVNGRYFTYLQQFSFGITMKWDDLFNPRPKETNSGRIDQNPSSVR